MSRQREIGGKGMELDQMTLREKIGQTVISLCTPEMFCRAGGSMETFIKKYPIGGLFPSGELDNGALSIVKAEEFQRIMAECNRYSRIPLIAAADGPNDLQGQLPFGSAMLLGAADDTALAYAYGRSMGERMSSCGLHWWFAPVVDLNLSPESPVCNVRAISDNASLAARIAKALIRGIEDSGVAATAKHFPGSYDKATVDPHLAPVSNFISREKWDANYKKLYSELFEDGVMSVMTGHHNLVCRQKEKIGGKYPPATMSGELVSDLLKGELGFEGVVVTDALVMGGFAGPGGVQNQVRSFAAGNDVVLWPKLEYIDLLEQEIVNGNIPMKRLDDAVRRILALKKKLGLLDGSFHRQTYDAGRAAQINKQLCEKGITLVQNSLNTAPAKGLKKVFIVGVTPDDVCYETLKGLQESFEKIGIHTDMQRDIWQDELAEKEKEYDLIVFALSRQVHKPIGPLSFWGKNASSIWASNSIDNSKLAVVSFGDPYAYRYYRETDTTYINAYMPAPEMFDAFVEALTGRIPFAGKSPVDLSEAGERLM